MAHIWYEGTSHQYTSPGTKVKVICKGQGQISGSCFSKDGCYVGISVSQMHLVFTFPLPQILKPHPGKILKRCLEKQKMLKIIIFLSLSQRVNRMGTYSTLSVCFSICLYKTSALAITFEW